MSGVPTTTTSDTIWYTVAPRRPAERRALGMMKRGSTPSYLYVHRFFVGIYPVATTQLYASDVGNRTTPQGVTGLSL